MFFRTSLKRKYTKYCLAIAAASLLPYTLSANAYTCNDSPEAGRYYSIVNVGSGMALDVSGAIAAQSLYESDADQQFQFNDLGNGYLTIQPINSSQVLAVDDLSDKDGAHVLQIAYDGAKSQE
jgi:hypothetical protein